MASVVIDIASEFTGKKAFSQAEMATKTLTKSVKGLAGALGIAFGSRAVVAFAKASIKAFAADEAAARRLSTAVDNLGIGFANPEISQYIANLEKSASIADDLLRPALQALLTTTGSLTKSQELLSNAIQISRASGIDLVTVADDLAKGFVGTTKGLSKYNSGLTKAELQSKSFNEILGVILARSAGAAEDYLTTTSYKMDALSIATNNATEIIGGGFVDALARASGGTEASDAAIFLETMARLFNKITLAAGTSIGAIPTLAQNLKKLGKDIFLGFAGKQAGVSLVPVKKDINKLTLTEVQKQQALAKLQANALKREKELLALKNKQNDAAKLKTAIDKANLALGKGSNIFDIDAIQINAALIGQAEALGKATSGAQVLAIANDIQRLKIKQDISALEDAIASKDTAAIEKATAKLNEDMKILGALQKQDAKLLDINNVLAGMRSTDLINLANLQAALDLLAKFKFPTLTMPGTSSITSPGGSGIDLATIPKLPKLTGTESIEAIIEVSNAVTELNNALADQIDARNAAASKALDQSILTQLTDAFVAATLEANRERYGNQGMGAQITIQDRTSGLIEIVQTAVQENNRFGNNLNFAGAL